MRVRQITKKFGTPVYIYSRRTLIDHYRKIKMAFRSIKPLICFSVKANSNLAVLKTLVTQGAGLDVVSGGELYKALKVGANVKKIVYAGVGKSEEEIAQGIKAGILFFNAESFAELGLIERVASRLDKKVSVALRMNPDVDPKGVPLSVRMASGTPTSWKSLLNAVFAPRARTEGRALQSRSMRL